MAQRFDIHTTDFGWNRVPPTVRLIGWLAVVVAIAGVVQAVAWLIGAPFLVTSPKNGQTVMLVTLLATAGFIMSRARRTPGEYGLAISDHWRAQALIGLVLGVGGTVGLAVLAVASGAAKIDPSFTASKAAPVIGEALAGALLATVVVFLAAGFMAGELRQRHRPAGTTLIVALLGGTLFLVSRSANGLDTLDGMTTLTATLVIALVVALRTMTGDIVLGLGLLIGGLCVERIARKMDLLTAGVTPRMASQMHRAGQSTAWVDWLAPQGNPRVGYLLWVVLAVGVAAVLWLAHARPFVPRPGAEKRSLPRSFKRVYPISSMGLLATLDVWLAQLWRARFRVGLIYLPRLLVTLLVSAVNTLLCLPERLILPLLLRCKPVKPPIFILGVHRSGTTHLQNLLALDKQLITPSAHAVMNPRGFRFSGYLLWPLLIIGTPWKRPMDGVRFGLSAPNEEEYAIANLCGLSPDWSIRLPRRWGDYDRYTDPARFTAAERERWKRVVLGFLRRLVMRNDRRPMLKNPYNTGRVALLRELFPAAKFIHIHRHPFDTYRSNLHMASEAHCLFELQPGLDRDVFAAWFLESYRASEDRFYRDTADLPADQVAEVRFEDLERDPISEVKRLYQRLGLDYTDVFDAALRHYLADIAGYKKNVHRPMPEDEQQHIRAALGPLMQRWGYA